MDSLVWDVAANVLGNIFAWLLLGVATLLLVRHRARTKFDSFFGLKNGRKVIVYLSNLWDPKRAKADKPWGSIVAGQEFQASQAVSRLFGVSPFSLPEIVRGFVDAFWLVGKVGIELTVSPVDAGFDASNNLIVVGSAQKNTVRRAYARRNALHVIIDGEPIHLNDNKINIQTNPLMDQFKVLSGARAGDTPTRNGDYELAIIEKVREQNRVAFFCVGATGYGSRAAIEYLARNWEDLWSTHKDHSFARCLWFPKKDIRGELPNWDAVEYEDVH